MTTNSQLQNISCNVRLRNSKIPGLSNVIILVIIDRESLRIPLGINWPTENFDRAFGKLLPRKDDDQECTQNNLVIDKYIGIANNLRLQYYAFGGAITLSDFKESFKTFYSRKNFVSYMSSKIDTLSVDWKIKPHTRDIHVSVLTTLKSFLKDKVWLFSQVKSEDLEAYKTWLSKYGKSVKSENGMVRTGLAYNTMVGHLKVINKYFNLAIRDKIINKNPVKGLIPTYKAGIRQICSKEDVISLLELKKSNRLSAHERDVVDRYLLSCFTGFRKSDIEQLKPKKHIQQGVITITPSKTADAGTVVHFKIPEPAMEILRSHPNGFNFMESALLNKTLKVVASKAGIEKYLKFHSSRDTFAVLYVKFGGNIADLKEILGHQKISTTEIYLKMGRDAKDETLNEFNKIS